MGRAMRLSAPTLTAGLVMIAGCAQCFAEGSKAGEDSTSSPEKRRDTFGALVAALSLVAPSGRCHQAQRLQKYECGPPPPPPPCPQCPPPVVSTFTKVEKKAELPTGLLVGLCIFCFAVGASLSALVMLMIQRSDEHATVLEACCIPCKALCNCIRSRSGYSRAIQDLYDET